MSSGSSPFPVFSALCENHIRFPARFRGCGGSLCLSGWFLSAILCPLQHPGRCKCLSLLRLSLPFLPLHTGNLPAPSIRRPLLSDPLLYHLVRKGLLKPPSPSSCSGGPTLGLCGCSRSEGVIREVQASPRGKLRCTIPILFLWVVCEGKTNKACCRGCPIFPDLPYPFLYRRLLIPSSVRGGQSSSTLTSSDRARLFCDVIFPLGSILPGTMAWAKT